MRRRRLLGVLALALLLLVTMRLVHANNHDVLPQSAIGFLSDVRLPAAGQSASWRMLVFSPHPDDETLGAGAYIAMSVDRGAIVRIVLVTNGNRHRKMRKRYAEFRRATSILGVPERNLVFLGYPDKKLRRQDPEELSRKFEAEIEGFDPNIVIYSSPQDRHPDHATIGRLVQTILRGYPDISGYQYLVHHSHFPRPRGLHPEDYILPPASMFSSDAKWYRLLVPPDIEDRQTSALFQYKTQLWVPFLRGLMLSFLRKDEIFATDAG